MLRLVGTLLLACATGCAGTGTTPDPRLMTDAERVRELDRIVRGLAASGDFSGVVLLARGERVLYERAHGFADSAGTVPLTVESTFDVASLVKPLLTVAVAQLVEQRRLSWEDSIGGFLPDWPAAVRGVRVRHLLTHSSGLPEIRRVPDDPTSLDDFLRVAREAVEGGLEYAPGASSTYRNISFIVLARIVEAVTGEAYHAYVRRAVIEPAGMSAADYGARGFPTPYCCTRASARDLLRFAQALQSGKLLRPETVEVLLTPKPEAGEWGYGFDVLDAERGLVGHGGSFTNLSHAVDMFTRSGHTLVIMTNRTGGRSPLREAIRSILP